MLPRRRHEISRLEAFSDAAFAFALTLLVVSLDVPRSYDQLIQLMKGFFSFACCFALLVWIWHEHNVFFRRSGLQDSMTVFLNGLLLFVVLFYVYPLKFMFDSMFAMMIPGAYPDLQTMSLGQLSRASAIYGLGFVAMFLMFALLYGHAYRKRVELRLTPVEVFDIKAFAGHHLISAGVGVVAFLVAVLAPLRFAPLSPVCFGLMGPAHWFFGNRMDQRRLQLMSRLEEPAAAPQTT
jgi:Endosomal/lysosomal potassium channel TMEM175